ncbi:MAG: homoserine dehydrogenase [Euryarchaeota archaeon]|jgi:ACT domain-containing protein|nr:homoserine dehydrogenase [Euryarchaeota archaeon]
MLVNAELYVKDLPGQLVGSLEPISMVNGNIVGVVHNRDRIINHRICVNVTFEVDNNDDLEKLKNVWKARDVLIDSIGSVYKTASMEYLLLGLFNASYVEELIEKAAETVPFESVDVSYSTANHTKTRTAMITVEVLNEDDLDKLNLILEESCREEGIVYIRGL